MGLQMRHAPSRKVRIITTLIAVFALVAQPLYGMLNAHIANAIAPVGSIKNVQSGETFSDFAAAINDAETTDGNTLRATGEFTVSSSVAVNKSLTITGQPAVISTDSATNVFHVTAANVKINGFTFDKTDTAGDFRFINLVTSATDAKVWDNTFHSGFNIGDGNTVRGIVVSPGTNGYDIRNNTFSHVRQPAYIDASTGTVRGNHTDNTKGWVITSGSNVTFTNNTWGTGADRNVIDIAIIAEATNNYSDADVVQMSNKNNDAVVENQFGGNKVLSDAYVEQTDNGKSGDTGSAWHPYTKIQDAFSRIVEGGTVHVANGNYVEALVVKKQGTQLVGESQSGVNITPLSNQYGQGLTSEGLSKISLSNFTINAASANGGGYALKAHNGSNLKITNVTVNGAGPAVNMGGVDISGINGVVVSNVTSQNFKKNGFAFSSRYDASDPFTRNVTLDNVVAKNNGWAGVAFYATNNAGTVGHSFTDVAFTGANTISGNSKGLEIVGDSDANIANGLTPRYSILNAANGPVDLASIDFVNNAAHIVNNQVTNLLASDTTFDGKLQKDMISNEVTALNGKIFDKADKLYLGQVVIDTTSPSLDVTSPNESQLFGSTNLTLNVNATASDSSGLAAYYVALDGVGKKYVALPTNGVMQSTLINLAGVSEGQHTVLVRVTDKWGNAKEVKRKIVIDNTAPVISTNISEGQTLNGTSSITLSTVEAHPKIYNIRILDGAGNVVKVNGVAQGAYDGNNTSNSFTYDWDTTQVANGSYKLQFSAKDAIGNAASTIFRTVQVNNAPVISPSAPELTMNSTLNGRTVSGTVNVSNAVFTVTIDDVSRADVVPTIGSQVGSDYEWSFVLPSDLSTSEAHKVKVIATANGVASQPQENTFPAGDNELNSGLTAQAESEFQNRLTSLNQPFTIAAPFNPATPAEVLGASDSNTDVLGAQTLKDSAGSDVAAIAATPQGWKIFGIAWYWILIAIIVLASIVWWAVAAAKRRTAEDV